MVKIVVSTIALLATVAGVVRGGVPSRTFDFTYGGVITGVKPGDTARVWLPVATTSPEQVVQILRHFPAQMQTTHCPSDDTNTFLYSEAQAAPDGSIWFLVVYRVTRYETGERRVAGRSDDSRYLKADALVPVRGKPAKVLLSGKTLPKDQLRTGRFLFDLVDDYMQYRKDRPGWGRGDANWACDSGFGNCTDFHSLFASLGRSADIPVKMEFGFQIPDQRGKGTVAGYHCWAKFRADGHGWVPVDISRANQDPAKREYYFGHLDENRVQFSTGRDLELVPRQAGPPINFLVYPYVEVNGRPYPQEKITHEFAYEDVAQSAGDDAK